MLEGLEAVEISILDVKIDNPSFRFDSEYFRKYYLNFYDKVKNIEPLSNFVADGYRVVYENTKVVDKKYALENNLPMFLQATDIETPFINTDNIAFVDNYDWERYPKGRVNKGEILIEVKGKIEKVALVPDDFPDKVLITGSVYKMTLNDDINKFYLLSYLISKYGVAFKDRYKSNLLISFLSKEDLYRMPIPIPTVNFQKVIEREYLKAIEYKNNASVLYCQAEEILLFELGLKDWEPTNQVATQKSFADFMESGRLDAEYYQPKYDEIERKIKAYKGGYDIVGNFFTQNKKSCKFNLPSYKYIEIRDVNVNDGEISHNIIDVAELPANAKIEINQGDLLISKVRPYRGAIGIVKKEQHKAIASGAFTVLEENSNYKKEVLQVLLRTLIYKDWLLKWNVGSSYPVIKDEDILSLIIPNIAEDIQDHIAKKIHDSFALKAESKRLLDITKTAVEIAIEQGEQKAMELLKQS